MGKRYSLNFSVISHTIMAREDLKAADKMVMLALQRWGWDSRRCTASIENICEAISLPKRTVQRSLANLVILGLIGIESDPRYSTQRAIILLWMDDPSLHPNEINTTDVQEERQPGGGERQPGGGERQPGTQRNSSATDKKTMCETAAAAARSVPPPPFAGAHTQIQLTIETARKLFGDEAAKTVEAKTQDIIKTLDGRVDCYIAALREAGLRKEPPRNPHAYCLKVARKFVAEGIPPEAKSSTSHPRPAEITQAPQNGKARPATSEQPTWDEVRSRLWPKLRRKLERLAVDCLDFHYASGDASRRRANSIGDELAEFLGDDPNRSSYRKFVGLTRMEAGGKFIVKPIEDVISAITKGKVSREKFAAMVLEAYDRNSPMRLPGQHV